MSTFARVLVLADSNSDVELIKQSLGSLSSDISNCLASDFFQSPEAFHHHTADQILLLRAQTPTISLDLIREVRQASIDSPLIILVDSADHRFAVDAMRSGANDVLVASEIERLPDVIKREQTKLTDKPHAPSLESDLDRFAKIVSDGEDGKPFWNELSTSPELDAAGRLVQHIGDQSELTGRRLSEKQLRQAQKMEAFAQLAGYVAHDFNNLLTVINGFSELAYVDTKRGDLLREQLSEICDAGESAARRTQTLLAFSRQAIITPRVLDLNEVVESVTKLLWRLLGKIFNIETSLAQEPCRIFIDLNQMEQAILTFVVNSRDAMPHGGDLKIATTLEENFETPEGLIPGKFVRLTVSDTGCGMPKEVMARIFEPFFTTKVLGTARGLGLSFVYGMVKQHNGYLDVESQVGVGSSFIIRLPYCDSKVSERGESSSAPTSLGCETILLAVNEYSIRKLAKIALELLGCHVLEAQYGFEAKKLAETYKGPIDLLVTDVVIVETSRHETESRKMGGRQLFDAVRAIRPGIKVLFLSGHTNDALLRSGIETATYDCLQKPFTPSVLGKKVREVLDAVRRDTHIG